MVYVVMGVAGSGKTTVGTLLAERIGARFVDADDYHPETNITKMKQGIPLDDNDRREWLELLSKIISEHVSLSTPKPDLANDKGLQSLAQPLILACSALKQKYRDILIGGCQPSTEISFIYLKCSIDTAQKRAATRPNHFMPPSLIDSQFADLEEPAGESVIIVDGEADVSGIVENIAGARFIAPAFGRCNDW